MTAQDKAHELIDKFTEKIYHLHQYPLCVEAAQECALIAIDEIINSNPHANPLNTNGHSTMAYWLEVKQEIETL